MRSSSTWLGGTVAVCAVLLFAHGCGSDDSDRPGADGGDNGGGDGAQFGDVVSLGGDASGGAGDGSSGACVNLQCQQHTCSDGGTTTISGTVFDPAGKNPLYGVVVYVPNSTPQALPSGASCDSCDSLFTGEPIAATVTDATGHFVLPNAPDNSPNLPAIPLVLQVGKWRMQTTVATVARCQDNPQADGTLKLPNNHMVGDIPNVAISTGGSDTLECLLSRIGVDKAEYVPGTTAGGRIHVFQGGDGYTGMFGVVPNTSPAAPSSSVALWSSQADLMPFDMVILSCEGEETAGMDQAALHAYASAGGRVFASHFHYAWFNTGPYAAENLATWTPGSNNTDTISAIVETTLPNAQPFPKGVALKQWLGVVGALTNGELPILQSRHNADVGVANTPSTPWLVADPSAPAPGATQYFSFNTPTDAPLDDAGVPEYCGRVVYTDLHVGGASGDDPTQPVPSDCAVADLSAQEKALEFMLFDLSACITIGSQPPMAPPTMPPPR